MNATRIVVSLLLAVLSVGCAGGGVPSGPPPSPVSCPPGEHLVCRGQTATRLERRDPTFCMCEPVPGLQ